MNPPSFWAHNGALYMSMKEIAALKWSSSSQSSKKLKGKVLKACDVGLLLSGGGQAPKYVHTDDVEKIVVLEMRDEARRISPIENQLQAIPASLTFWNGGRECHCVFPSCTLMHGEFWPFPTLLVM